jgi:hypothetical protein
MSPFWLFLLFFAENYQPFASRLPQKSRGFLRRNQQKFQREAGCSAAAYCAVQPSSPFEGAGAAGEPGNPLDLVVAVR